MRALRILAWTFGLPLGLMLLVPAAGAGGVVVTQLTGLRGPQASFLAAQLILGGVGFAIALLRRDPPSPADAP